MTTRIDVAIQTPRLNLNVIRRPTLKFDVLPRYPYSLTASSPILLSTAGGAYNISFDAISGAASMAPYIVASAPADGSVYGSKNGIWAKAVDRAGDTMTGPLILNADPTNALGAVTKQMSDLKAPLASPTLTGDPKAPTPAVDDNDTSIATTAYVIGQASAASPQMDGSAAAGSSTRWARGDHVHPTDTSRAPLASPALTGTPTAPTATLGTNTTQIATTAFVLANAITGTTKFGKVNVQVFTTPGTSTYTPSANILFAIIECVGGGGAGGGSAGATTYYLGGGGGGGGGYSQKVVTAATVGASQTVTVGAGGTVGAAGGNAGNAGGDSSVGVLCVGKGGTGGSGVTSGATSGAGAGGVAGTGDFTVPGGHGGGGFYLSAGATGVAAVVFGGEGGASFFGGKVVAGGAASSSGNGATGKNYGGGGSGGASANNASNTTGGAGAAGIVVITEFCSS